MDLKKRLARLDRRPGESPPRRARGPLCPPADLGLAADPQGGIWTVEETVRLSPPQPLPDLRGFLSRHAEAAVRAEDILFLDLETTGLAGGTGTVPFVVGLAWWQRGSLRIRQHFLPGPEHEAVMLAAIATATAGHTVVASYNGASFDWPLVRTRALLNRQTNPLSGLRGWDLVVPARRLWSRSLADCRQQTLEREICGRVRGPGDIPGEQIPRTWFDFLAGGDPEPVRRVLTHNRRDMEGMAHIFKAVVAQAAVRLPGADTDWRRAWALGRIHERREDAGAAEAWLRAGVTADGVDWSEARFVADALRILKRSGDWAVVANIVAQALSGGLEEPWLHREAAILFEHRLPNPAVALAHARLSGDDHRVLRLERRLAAAAVTGLPEPEEDT